MLENKRGHRIDFDAIDRHGAIVDAGACLGDFSIWMWKRGYCNLHLIEPCRRNYDYLKARMSLFPLYQNALVGCIYDSNIVQFNDYLSYRGRGSIMDKHSDDRYASINHSHVSYAVKAIPINSLIYSLSISTIEYLKLDIEGSEYDIVSSMSKETAKHIKQFSMEIHPIVGVHLTQQELADVYITRLGKFGFKCEYFTDQNELWGIK